MASIASPRLPPASGASTPTNSSQRTSLDTTRTLSPARAPQPSTRRNRTALRDYYNLKPTNVPASSSASIASEDASVAHTLESELDKPGFDAATYVQGLLEKEGLQGVLRVEGGLLNEIRELDGERKALVYDNYSKLIKATETIKGMRSKMEPLGKSTGDLKGMVERVAETAGGLADSAVGKEEKEGRAEGNGFADVEREKRRRDTVGWVVQSPLRLKKLVDGGKRGEAEKEWDTISRLLDKWESVEGVSKIRDDCLEVLKEEPSDEEE